MIPSHLKITVTRFGLDGEPATLSEIYQVGRHLPQKVVGPVGRWLPSASPADAHAAGDARPRTNSNAESRMHEASTRGSPMALSKPSEVDVAAKSLAFGTLEAPVDDPLRRRRDLTGLHLVCTTIEVGGSGVGGGRGEEENDYPS